MTTNPISQARKTEEDFNRLKPYIQGLVQRSTSSAATTTVTSAKGPTLSITDFGVKGDGVNDDDKVFQQALDLIGKNGGGYVWCKAQGDAFVIASRLEVRSNTTLHFLSPIKYKAKGQLSFFGEVDAFPELNKPRLRADAASGTKTLQLMHTPTDDYTNFVVGGKITLRGLSDGAGQATEKQTTFVTAINAGDNSLTIRDELDFDFKAVYPAGDYEENFGIPDRTYIQNVVFSKFTRNIVPGECILPVEDASLFNVGDYVELSDDTLIVELYPPTTYPESRSRNQFRIEMARIKAVDTGANTIEIDRNCYHDYVAANGGGITRIKMTIDAHIIGAHAEYIEDPPTRNFHSFQSRMGVACSFKDCSIRGNADFGGRGHGFRIDQSLDCTVEDCAVYDPKFYDSAEGYAFTLYGATHCSIINCYASTCRHTVLLFKGSSGNLIRGCTSVGCRISDYDLHGGNCKYNSFIGNYAIGGPLGTPDSSNKAALKVGNTTHAVGDHHNLFEGNLIVDYPGQGYIDNGGTGSGIEIVPQSSDNVFRNNVFINCYRGFYTKSAARFWDKKQFRNTIEGNKFDGCSLELCYVGGDSDGYVTIENLTFRNNSISGCSRHLIIDGCNGLTITGNLFERPSGTDVANPFTISVSDSTNVRILENVWIGTARGVKLTNCPSAIVGLNRMVAQTHSSAFQDAGGNTNYLLHRNSYVGFSNTYSGIGTSSGGTILEEGSGGGGGSITTVAGAGPISVTGGTGPTATVGIANQSANTVLAGPTAGGAGAVTARALVAADLPTHLHGLADLLQGGATTGQVATWTGAAWAPVTPSSGLGGSIASGQIAVGSGTNTLTGSSTFVWDGSQLGVGVASPERAIHTRHVNNAFRMDRGDGAGPGFFLVSYTDATYSTIFKVWYAGMAGTDAFAIRDHGTVAGGGGTERLRITGTGSVLIGKSSGLTGAGDLDANGRIRGATFETATGNKWELGARNNALGVAVDIDGSSYRLAEAAKPSFHAYRNSIHTGIVPSTDTIVVFNQEYFDTDGWYNVSNGRLTVALTCVMQINVSIMWSNTVEDQKPINLILKRNGTVIAGVYNTTSGTGVQSQTISHVVDFTAGQYLEVYVSHGGSYNYALNPSGRSINFSGRMIQ